MNKLEENENYNKKCRMRNVPIATLQRNNLLSKI